MDANGLSHDFKLGDWRVQPRMSLIAGPDGARALNPDQLGILLCLARRRGEIVGRRELCEQVWPGQDHTEERLTSGIGSLRELLSGSVTDQHYVANVGNEAFALVARYERIENPPPSMPAAAPDAGGVSRDRRTASSHLQSFVVELKRRSVFKVVGAYLVGMWIVLQVAEVTFEPLRFPDWWMTALTILAVLGLPIVSVLAWSYEITPGGIVLDSGLEGGVRLPRARRAIAPALVAGVALMAAVTGFAWLRTISEPVVDGAESRRFEPSAQSIAVLPLVDMSPNGESAYLGDGLSEELSSDLAKLPGLRVAARTSAFAFKGKDMDVRRIGEELGVRYVLEGSVRREGERVRVTAQLIDSISGFHVWTESYDRPWQDLIAIQQDISGAIAAQLQAVLTPELAAQLKTAPTRDPRAYDFYLAGLSELRQAGALSGIAEAESLFRRSLEADPGFSRAQAALCQVAVTRYERTSDVDNMQDAETACRAALEADPTLKETEHALARLYGASGRNEQAEAVYRSLMTRSPRDAEVHIGLGKALQKQNRVKEAERSFREAIVVEPGYWAVYNALGGFLFGQGRNREAAEAYAHVTELAPRSASGYNNLGAALLASGEFQASAKAFETSTAIEPSRSAYANLGTLYYYLGRFEDAVGMYSKGLEIAPEDFQLWGGRADSLWYLPQQRQRALEDYRRAVALAEKNLAVDATDGEVWALLGFYYGRLGDHERSGRYVDRAIELEPGSPYVNYFAAVTAADRGDRELATQRIRKAIDSGYSRLLAAPDPALKGIPLG